MHKGSERMAYEVYYEKRDDYLYAHISGPESVENACQFFEELRKIGKNENINAFLIVDEVKGILTMNETFFLSKEIAKLHQGNIIAFVDPKEETYHLNAFGGTVVGNRGVITRVFKNEKEAEQWLKEVLRGT